MRKKIAVLGSTGSIGKGTLEVARHLKDDIEIVALAAKTNIELLEIQAREFSPEVLAVYDESQALELQKRIEIPVLAGMEGLKAIAKLEKADFVMLAIMGSSGLIPALSAIDAGKQIGLATKEVLISAGELIQKKVKEKGVDLIPVDSEHSALFQCLHGEKSASVGRLILTASGGPFKNTSISELETVSLKQAMNHPNYTMGPKVTVDSSTLMNKGLEMIEARYLYDIPPEKVEAIIHPEQRIHSFVEFVDGSMMAQISEPDMLLPIQYAMTYPERKPGILPPYDFTKNPNLTFSPPDRKKFRCLRLAEEAMNLGQSYPCFLNAANEILVERFLNKQISWIEIGIKLEKLISSHQPLNLLTLDAILEVDGDAREQARVI